MYICCKKTNSKPSNVSATTSSKTSWEMVKDLMVDADKRDLFAERAESLLHSLKQRFPGLPQTSLDMSKIQYNKVHIYYIQAKSFFVFVSLFLEHEQV